MQKQPTSSRVHHVSSAPCRHEPTLADGSLPLLWRRWYGVVTLNYSSPGMQHRCWPSIFGLTSNTSCAPGPSTNKFLAIYRSRNSIFELQTKQRDALANCHVDDDCAFFSTTPGTHTPRQGGNNRRQGGSEKALPEATHSLLETPNNAKPTRTTSLHI